MDTSKIKQEATSPAPTDPATPGQDDGAQNPPERKHVTKKWGAQHAK